MIAGLVSIGTNSTRALVADPAATPPQLLLIRSTGTRIGEGLAERGMLAPAPMSRTLDAVAQHVRAMRELPIHSMHVIATSALRRAQNAGTFIAEVRAICGCDFTILTGEEEAQCSFAGAACGLPAAPGQLTGVVDLGGGSIEYAVGGSHAAERAISCEIGAVRLTQSVPALSGQSALPVAVDIERAYELAREAVASMASFPPVRRLVLVGGTATTTVALLRGSREINAYEPLSRAELRGLIAQLSSTPLDARRTLPGMNPQRADILLAGQIVLDAVLDRLEPPELLVSTNDLLLGFLLRRAVQARG